MWEVYESRATHVEHQKRLINNDKDMVRWDMDDLKKTLEEQNWLAEEKRIQAQLAKATHQNDVLLQVGEKERFKKREYQETMFEEWAMKLAEIEYKKKIDQDKAINEQILNKMRSSRPF